MPTPQEILSQIRCCLNDDGHIVHEPILLKCGANACKKCVNETAEKFVKCFSCEDRHEKSDVLNVQVNHKAESIIISSLGMLFHDLALKVESVSALIKGNFNSIRL